MQGSYLVPRIAIQQIDAAHQALLLAKAEHVEFAEIEMHYMVIEFGGRVIFQIDDNRQVANFARVVQRFRRGAGKGSEK